MTFRAWASEFRGVAAETLFTRLPPGDAWIVGFFLALVCCPLAGVFGLVALSRPASSEAVGWLLIALALAKAPIFTLCPAAGWLLVGLAFCLAVLVARLVGPLPIIYGGVQG